MREVKEDSMGIKLVGVSKGYKKNLVIKNIDLEIGEGIYGFLGANGVGKTTLFKIISGYFTKYKGKVIYPDLEGKEIPMIGYLPQEFKGYPQFSVYEFLKYIANIKGKKSDEELELEIENKLEIFNLKEIKNKKLKSLSGGQKRRVGLAQAFLLNPKIVLLDEPTTGLDPNERIHFKNYISNLKNKQIILISTHIVSDLEYIAKKIFILKDGTIVEEGAEEELKNKALGYIWEVVPESIRDREKIITEHLVSKIYESNDSIRIRIISENRPNIKARKVEPTLEDIYLMHFQREGKEL